MKAAIEDVRTALPENSIAGNILEGVDVITNSIEDCIDDLYEELASSSDCTPHGHAITQAFYDSCLENNDDEDRLTPLPSVGDDVEVYWPEDEAYYPGTVAAINEDDSKYHIGHDDGDNEVLDMCNEMWTYSLGNAVNANNARLGEQEISSSEQQVLTNYTNLFGQKPFTLL